MRLLLRLLLLTGLLLPGLTLPQATAQRQSQFIDPAATDPAITAWTEPHYASLDPSASGRNQLFLFFPGTGGLPRHYQLLNEFAAGLGFHALSLRYPNDRAVNTLCALRLSLDCHGEVRLEIVDGTDRTNLVDVDRTNSIENRLIKALQYLDATAPGEGWGQYLHADGTINWAQIVVVGHSQGGGHAAIIASEHVVARVVMLAALDYNGLRRRPAGWIDADNPTPPHRYYGFGHIRDEPVDLGNLLTTWETYGLDAFGAVVNIDTLGAPFGGSHRLLTDTEPRPHPLSLSPFHNSVAVDVNTPRRADGTPALDPVWAYLLTDAATTVATEPTDLPEAIRLDQNYPNPLRTATTIGFSLPHPLPVSLAIYDLLGRPIATLLSEVLPAGYHTVPWQPGDQPPGLYLYRLHAGGSTIVKSLLLLH